MTRGDSSPAQPAALTKREREVLVLILDGKSNREVGEDLGISPRTIEVHRARIMKKLGVHNTVQLVKTVLQRQMLEGSSS